MMAEVTAESPITVLPKEVMIEILSRVESSNPLQFRCVCKFWNSLVLDPQFVKNRFHISIADITNQFAKTLKEMHASNSLFIPNPSVPQEEEEEEDSEDEDEDEDEEEEEEAAEGEEEEGDASDDDDDDDYEVEDQATLMNAIVQLENLLLNVELENFKEQQEEEKKEEHEEEGEEGEVTQWIRNEVAGLDYFLVIIKFFKGRYEAFRDDVQTVEDRVKCLQSFLRFYLNSPSSH